MVMPSGLRSSEPTPMPMASGNPPKSAAMVVIMMGRKRSRHAWIDGFDRRQALVALGLQGEIDHHDGILFHNANEQNDADESDDAEVGSGEQQRQDCANPGRRQRGENREWVNQALVENAENDVDGDERSKNKIGLVLERILEGLRGSLEGGVER